jgi:8-amino-7-oxononanoate synthase
VQGQEWLYFSGTSYLGISGDATFRAHLAEGMVRYGANFGGSRLGNPRFNVFEEAEEYIARWTGAPSALTVSSGTLAGHLISAWARSHGPVFHAPGCHPAIWTDVPPQDIPRRQWIDQILATAHSGEGPMAICSNALDSLYARKFTFDWLSDLPSGRPIALILDDSHGLGVTGSDGGGIFSMIDRPENVQLIVAASLGKALGIPAGVILGPREVLDAVWESPAFGGASPTVPAYLYAFMKSEDLYRRQREQLFRNVRNFAAKIASSGLFQWFDDYPVFYSPYNDLASFLKERRVLISNFPYPTPEDEPLNRVVINSLHREEDIERLAGILRRLREW